MNTRHFTIQPLDGPKGLARMRSDALWGRGDDGKGGASIDASNAWFVVITLDQADTFSVYDFRNQKGYELIPTQTVDQPCIIRVMCQSATQVAVFTNSLDTTVTCAPIEPDDFIRMPYVRPPELHISSHVQQFFKRQPNKVTLNTSTDYKRIRSVQENVGTQAAITETSHTTRRRHLTPAVAFNTDTSTHITRRKIRDATEVFGVQSIQTYHDIKVDDTVPLTTSVDFRRQRSTTGLSNMTFSEQATAQRHVPAGSTTSTLSPDNSSVSLEVN